MLFKKKEIIGVGIIFLGLIIMTLYGFSASKRREWDFRRKLDLAALSQGLNLYKIDHDVYPLSSNGKILACRGSETKLKLDSFGNSIRSKKGKGYYEDLTECNWGKDALMDISDVNYPHYLDLIPQDPKSDKGDYYRYFSNGEEFMLLGAFEGKTEIEYSKNVKAAKIDCGRRFCNFAKVSPGSTLDKMLKEYENGISN